MHMINVCMCVVTMQHTMHARDRDFGAPEHLALDDRRQTASPAAFVGRRSPSSTSTEQCHCSMMPRA